METKIDRYSAMLTVTAGVVALLLIAVVYAAYALQQQSLRVRHLESQLKRLDDTVARRERLSPLSPVECDGVNGPGISKERPCRVEIWRLLRSPEQFVGRWVEVDGKYHSNFEQTVLYEIDINLSPTLATVLERPQLGLWVQINPAGIPRDRTRIVGRFKSGPSGHLGRYGASLEEAFVAQPSQTGSAN